MAVTFSPKAYESSVKPWKIEPSSVGYQNNKKYFDKMK